MEQEENPIINERQELKDVYEQTHQYFNRCEVSLKEILEQNRKLRPLDMATDYYWSRIPEEDQKCAKNIEAKLIQTMTRIMSLSKMSPIISEADQRDLSVGTKKIRASLRFHGYYYSDTDVIHDEGTVLGIKPATQSEDTAIDVYEARHIFNDFYDRVLYIVDLIAPGKADIVTTSSLQQVSLTKYQPNTAFIMMWMDKELPELDDVRDTIRDVFKSFGVKALRADDIEHEDTITKRILDEIAASEFLIADLTGVRPSVYYEVGYAHAMGKRVILYRKKGTPLHFDLVVHNCPEYDNLGDLKTKLTKRLQHMTGRMPNKTLD